MSRAAAVAGALVVAAFFALCVRQATSGTAAKQRLDAGHSDARAARLLDHAGLLNPDSEVDLQRARLRANHGDLAGAKQLLLGVVRREPENARAWGTIQLVFESSDPALARRAARRFDQLAPTVPRALTRSRTLLALTVLAGAGLVLRLLCARQSLYADEASTYWVTQRSFGGMLDYIANRMEITPPLSFAATWVFTRFGDGTFWMRAAPLLFGMLAIPAVYALGVRTVGRGGAAVAAALVIVSPFTIYLSSLSRAYSLLVLLSAVAVLSVLKAIDTKRRRWWVAYALAAAGAMLTHYTAIYALAALFGWVVLAAPEARRAIVVASAGAAVLFAPWAVTGLHNDLHSPDTKLAALLVDFTPGGVLSDVGHWVVGHPNGSSILHDLPGPVGLALIAAGLAVAATGLRVRRPPSRLTLVIALAVAAPIGATLESLLAPPSFTTNVMASSTPGLALLAGALTQAAGPRLRAIAVGLLLVGVAIGGVKAATNAYAGPDIAPAAALIDGQAKPADVVIDASGAAFGTPGPLTPLDLALNEHHRIVRFGVPEDRQNQFHTQATATPAQDVRRAVREAGGSGRIFISFVESTAFGPTSDPVPLLRKLGLPAQFRLVSRTAVISKFGRSDALLFSR